MLGRTATKARSPSNSSARPRRELRVVQGARLVLKGTGVRLTARPASLRLVDEMAYERFEPSAELLDRLFDRFDCLGRQLWQSIECNVARDVGADESLFAGAHVTTGVLLPNKQTGSDSRSAHDRLVYSRFR